MITIRLFVQFIIKTTHALKFVIVTFCKGVGSGMAGKAMALPVFSPITC